MCSWSWQHIEVVELELEFHGRDQSPFLKTGVKLACNQKKGSSTVVSEFVEDYSEDGS